MTGLERVSAFRDRRASRQRGTRHRYPLPSRRGTGAARLQHRLAAPGASTCWAAGHLAKSPPGASTPHPSSPTLRPTDAPTRATPPGHASPSRPPRGFCNQTKSAAAAAPSGCQSVAARPSVAGNAANTAASWRRAWSISSPAAARSRAARAWRHPAWLASALRRSQSSAWRRQSCRWGTAPVCACRGRPSSWTTTRRSSARTSSGSAGR